MPQLFVNVTAYYYANNIYNSSLYLFADQCFMPDFVFV